MNYKTRQPFPNAAYVEGQRNFTYFDRSLTSGLTDAVIESPGDFLYIDQASTGVVSVELNMRQGGTLAPILLAAGGSIECDFASIKLNATAQLNKSVRVIVGNGAKIKGGANVNASSMSVSVVDGGLARTQGGKTFSGFEGSTAAAAQYPYLQFFNPVGSGVVTVIKSLSVNLSVAGIISVKTYDTPLGTLLGTPTNKYSGQPAPLTQIRSASLPTQYVGTLALDGNYVAARDVIERIYSEPIILTSGKGLIVGGDAAASNLYVTVQGFEQ